MTSQCQGCGHFQGARYCAAEHDVTSYHGPTPPCTDRTDSARAGEDTKLQDIVSVVQQEGEDAT